ncbi:calcium-binding protein [Tropicibacter naphthalenivorans]|uniref:Cyclolysin n=1 Tax=Tropicibacter naphthalenivorans TaxID=441103 RepID=A0A0N7LYR3_9RHOB|nr:calcium-binding protein [Tropicibacter naphthalenivorans]CUH75585.1 Cyclolysin [Tropicibacter naphthalenivorans]SMC43363.1 Hemolysin-type calcium-binding repeat-containing protein [Tropicibacter naphthalenivorans]
MTVIQSYTTEGIYALSNLGAGYDDFTLTHQTALDAALIAFDTETWVYNTVTSSLFEIGIGAYDLIIDANGLGPIGSEEELMNAIMNGVATGQIYGVSLMQGTTTLAELSFAPGAYTLSSGSTSFELSGTLPTNLNDIFGMVFTLSELSMFDELTSDEQDDLIAYMSNWGLSGLKFSDGGTDILDVSLDATGLTINLDGFVLDFAADLSGNVEDFGALLGFLDDMSGVDARANADALLASMTNFDLTAPDGTQVLEVTYSDDAAGSDGWLVLVDGVAFDDILIDVPLGGSWGELWAWDDDATAIYGLDGNDELHGGDLDDLIDGGDDHDTLYGWSGDDTLKGGAGNDYIAGHDWWGNPNSYSDTAVFDVNFADAEITVLGFDLIQVSSADGVDTLSGIDFLDFLDGTVDAIKPGYNYTGGDTDDTFFLSELDDTASGGRGEDTIDGADGDDAIWGNGGNDVIWGGFGNDTLRGGRETDSIDGGEGDDSIAGQRHADTLDGGNGNDTVKGGGGMDEMYGGFGDDFLKGGTKDDILFGGEGNDLLAGNRHDDLLDGGRGNDTLFAGGDDDTLIGGEGDDWMKGGTGEDTFVFGDMDGNDTITDFDVLEDTILLDAFSMTATDFAATATVTADGVLLATSDMSILLEGLTTTDGLDAAIEDYVWVL